MTCRSRPTLTALTATLLAALLSPPLYAKPPIKAQGLWQYTPHLVDVKEGACNIFMTTWEDGEWTGTFYGTSREDGGGVIHCNGEWAYKAIVTFEQVTVEGKSGTVRMRVLGKRPNVDSDWVGKWVILGGTGELATLRGRGTWWGPGAPDLEQKGDIYYAGQIHWAP